MIIIRLARYGKTNDPFYRVVATDHRNKMQGKALDIVGHYHPKSKLLKLDKDAINAWVLQGAQLSPKVAELLKSK